mmetsp:Transcript_32747/g.73590  ORF Transcript_32747/g.73590 Transcript_32747/m.73590 type:complete len:200 (+) Transcript_32747:146-745(+)
MIEVTTMKQTRDNHLGSFDLSHSMQNLNCFSYRSTKEERAVQEDPVCLCELSDKMWSGSIVDEANSPKDTVLDQNDDGLRKVGLAVSKLSRIGQHQATFLGDGQLMQPERALLHPHIRACLSIIPGGPRLTLRPHQLGPERSPVLIEIHFPPHLIIVLLVTHPSHDRPPSDSSPAKSSPLRVEPVQPTGSPPRCYRVRE